MPNFFLAEIEGLFIVEFTLLKNAALALLFALVELLRDSFDLKRALACWLKSVVIVSWVELGLDDTVKYLVRVCL